MVRFRITVQRFSSVWVRTSCSVVPSHMFPEEDEAVEAMTRVQSFYHAQYVMKSVWHQPNTGGVFRFCHFNMTVGLMYRDKFTQY